MHQALARQVQKRQLRSQFQAIAPAQQILAASLRIPPPSATGLGRAMAGRPAGQEPFFSQVLQIAAPLNVCLEEAALLRLSALCLRKRSSEPSGDSERAKGEAACRKKPTDARSPQRTLGPALSGIRSSSRAAGARDRKRLHALKVRREAALRACRKVGDSRGGNHIQNGCGRAVGV